MDIYDSCKIPLQCYFARINGGQKRTTCVTFRHRAKGFKTPGWVPCICLDLSFPLVIGCSQILTAVG